MTTKATAHSKMKDTESATQRYSRMPPVATVSSILLTILLPPFLDVGANRKDIEFLLQAD